MKRRIVDAPWAHFLADDSGTVMIEIYGNRDKPLPDYRTMDPAELHLAFVSKNVAADTVRLRTADTHTLGDDTFAMIRDPWGLPLQLVQRGTAMI